MKTNEKPKKNLSTTKSQKKKQDHSSSKKRPISLSKLRFMPLITCIMTLIIIASILLTNESEYLYRVQELNLFLYTPLYFKGFMVASGGMLSYIGSFFTQFFYNPWMGVTLLCLWWALLMWMIKRTFRISNKSALILIYPVVLLLLTNVDLGYWIFYLKMRGHFFASTIGFTAAVAAVWAFRVFPKKYYIRTIWIILSVFALYPLIGFYSLLSSLLMGILTWRCESTTRKENIINSVIAIVSVIAIPLIYYRFVYYQTNIINIYWTGLPVFRIDESYNAYYIPYILISLYLAALAVTYKKKNNGDVKNASLWIVCQLAQIILVTVCTYHFWYKDGNFRKEMSMNRCVENLDWEGVLRIARNETTEPTRLMVMYKNLALFRLGRSGEEMYNYLDGAKKSNAPFEVHMMQVGGKIIYLNYGKLNFCYRWCLEDAVEFGWRVDFYRYLLKCALLNKEMKVARKYVDALKQTLFYKDWAEKYESYLKNPSLMQQDEEFKPIFHMLKYQDNLDSDNTLVELYLMKSFAHSDSNDPLLQEQTLISALQMKDIPLFWPRFTKYALLHPNKHMPRHYQEAAYLYGNLEHKVDISHMPFDKEVVQSYRDFMALAQECQNMNEDQMKEAFYPRFGNTFFYNYFLVRNQKSY